MVMMTMMTKMMIMWPSQKMFIAGGARKRILWLHRSERPDENANQSSDNNMFKIYMIPMGGIGSDHTLKIKPNGDSLEEAIPKHNCYTRVWRLTCLQKFDICRSWVALTWLWSNVAIFWQKNFLSSSLLINCALLSSSMLRYEKRNSSMEHLDSQTGGGVLIESDLH